METKMIHNSINKDRHRYKFTDCEADMSDRDWDEAFGVAEYND